MARNDSHSFDTTRKRSRKMPTDESLTDDLKNAVTGDDHPLGKKVPGAPFAVVALTYLLVLLAAVALIGFCISLFS